MRIGAAISGIQRQLLNQVASSNAAAAANALRLATGQRVNEPADDPAGFVRISHLQSRLGHVGQTLTQVQAASNIGAQIQLTLDEVRTQLDTLRSTLLTDENQTLTSEQRTEKQLEIDAAIEQIQELAGTEIEGRRRLDGSTDFRVEGKRDYQIRSVEVYGVPANGQTISGEVHTAARQASLTYSGSSEQITDNASFALEGRAGTTTITVTSGEALADVADRVNQNSHKTGIEATVDGDELAFRTVDFGSHATIEVDVSSGSFNVTGGNGDGTASGVDASATINGRALTSTTGRFDVSQNGLRFAIEFSEGFTGQFNRLTIDDQDVARFQLGTQAEDRTLLALPGIQALRLGGRSGTLNDLASGGSLAGLGPNTSQGIRVVDEALSQLTRLEARVDSFADITVASASELLSGYQTSLEESLVQINGIDENEESLLLTKHQDLADTALASLAILDQQRRSVLAIVQQIAGI